MFQPVSKQMKPSSERSLFQELLRNLYSANLVKFLRVLCDRVSDILREDARADLDEVRYTGRKLGVEREIRTHMYAGHGCICEATLAGVRVRAVDVVGDCGGKDGAQNLKVRHFGNLACLEKYQRCVLCVAKEKIPWTRTAVRSVGYRGFGLGDEKIVYNVEASSSCLYCCLYCCLLRTYILTELTIYIRLGDVSKRAKSLAIMCFLSISTVSTDTQFRLEAPA